VSTPAPLDTRFTGTATFQSSYAQIRGNKLSFPFSIQLNFNPSRYAVSIIQFPQLTSPPFPVSPLPGENRVTVSMTSNAVGIFDPAPPPSPASGTMVIPVSLLFHHSYRLFRDSDLKMVFTTKESRSPQGFFDEQGSPMESDGKIALVSAGAFTDGVLNGSDASFKLVGVVSPPPWL
jgi:hypothetical protein